MWSLGKVLNTPEVVRVYIGQALFLQLIILSYVVIGLKCFTLFPSVCSSFNDKPINEAALGPMGLDLFEKEQDDLLADLVDIPKKACDRRVRPYFFC